MKIVRMRLAGEEIAYGAVEPEGIRLHRGTPFVAWEPTETLVPFGEMHLLAPVFPTKVVGIGRNYADHAAEMGGTPPERPLMFLKPTTALIGPDDVIVLPPESSEVHYEAELAVVIGRMCRRVPADEAASVVLGYTCANDVTARDLQRSDGQWTRAKGFDTFCPLGPWIDTDLDPADVLVECEVNGVTVQSASTATLIHSVPALVEAVSAVMTLLPGDVILTGTPAGVGPLVAGDEVSVTVAGLGTLVNKVR